jgi:hypothetical protein
MRDETYGRYWARSQGRTRRRQAPAIALTAFVVLCIAVLTVAPQLVEPDDYAYRASIVAITDGHLLTLSTAQTRVLAAQLWNTGSGPRLTGGPAGTPPSLTRWRWEQVSKGHWLSEKNPGYPFLAAPFQLLGAIRLAPLFFGGLACLGMFLGARRWLGSLGAATAVGLYCSSGAALVFAWRDYMPTFTDASLIAAGAGALLWAVLAGEASARRRTWVGLAGLLAIEAAVFVRYTDVVALLWAVAAVVVLWRLRPRLLPPGALRWWLGSVVLYALGLATFNAAVYGGPLKSGYRAGEVTFAASAVLPNLERMPAHLIGALPMMVLGLAAVVWIVVRGTRNAANEDGAARDLAVGLALAGTWLTLWALYAAYTWTAQPGLSTLQSTRFYVPAIGPIALLGAWLTTRLSVRLSPGELAPVAVLVVMFALGVWSFAGMRPSTVLRSPHCNIGQAGCHATPPRLPNSDGATVGSR